MSGGIRIDEFWHWPHIIPEVTQTSDGVMSAADKVKLDSLTPGAGGATFYATFAAFPNPVVANGLFAIANDTQILYVAGFGAWWPVVVMQ